MPFDDRSQGYLEQGYALGRGYASSLRLNFQHQLLRDLLGYTVHPEIRRLGNLGPSAKIADVGTGTAQWLLDVHRDFPTAQLEGFDISKDQYPHQAWIPNPKYCFKSLI